MKKRYIFGIIAAIAIIIFLVNILFGTNSNEKKINELNGPRLGQKLWTYNMNKYEWHNYKESDDDNSKEEIVLQYQGTEISNGYTSYKLLTDNYQVPKEDVLLGEGSQEFLVGKELYSYLPRTFEYNQVIFNGVIFVLKKLSLSEISKLFKDYQIIKLSDIQKGNFTVSAEKNNKFVLINDGDKEFYKYYIVPNDSKKMEMGKFSNQFKVMDDVDIKVQRLEGCTKAYPCYEFSIKKP